MTGSDIIERILTGLNQEQRSAVTASHRGQLQIVAGPGTGKTKVLTARVAYLLVHHNIQPWQLIVTTFTRKAAQEMKTRLAELLQGTHVQYEKLLIGTFHSICIRILRRYGSDIGLDPKFFVANNKDINDILESFLEDSKPELDAMRACDEKSKTVRDLRSDKDLYVIAKIKRQIAHLKCNGLWPDDYCKQTKDHSQELLKIYTEMHRRMTGMNMLDFDDILIYTVRLLQEHTCLATIRHVLVDEFQDTNAVQMELLKLFASQNTFTRDNITVVGDVDQSIYAFRGANAKNFETLMKEYPSCQMVQLRENYRSTQDVLDASECFMRVKKTRIKKDLRSQHTQSFPVVHQTFGSDYKEAQFIAQEIKFLKSLPDLYSPKDIAVLVRANFMTRVVEKELSSLGLPYSVIKGRAFWERKEVMATIDLLKSIGRNNDRCAIVRSLVVNGEGVGGVTMKKVNTKMEELSEIGVPPVEVLRRISQGDLNISGMTKKAKESCDKLVRLIDTGTNLYNDELKEREDAINLFEFFYNSDGIQRIIGDEKERQENVEEVKKQLQIFTPEILEMEPGMEEHFDLTSDLSFLEHFLNSIDIYTPEEVTEGASDNDPEDKIAISTIHSSKGLEWPVVFVLGINGGQFPSGRTDDIRSDPEESINEDRRVFYVSTTRAKHLLYLTSSCYEKSEFLKPLEKAGKIKNVQSAFKSTQRIQKLYHVAGITEPHNTTVDKFTKYYDTLTEQRKGEFGDGYGSNGNWKTNFKNNGIRFAGGRETLQIEESYVKEHVPQYAPKTTVIPKARKFAPTGNTAMKSQLLNRRVTSCSNHNSLSAISTSETNEPLKGKAPTAPTAAARPLSTIQMTDDNSITGRPALKPMKKKTLGMKRRRV